MFETSIPPPAFSDPDFLEVEDNRCFDCERDEVTYMVHDTVWLEAWPTYGSDLEERRKAVSEEACAKGLDGDLLIWRIETHGRLFLCLGCLELRLGRNLIMGDFTPWEDAPCNRLILLGWKLAKASKNDLSV